jgi:prefoldin subunit 5
MAKYQRDPVTGVLVLKDANLVQNYDEKQQVNATLEGLQNQINTLNARIEELTELIQTRLTWHQTPDQT